jgi:3-dehydroquinate synthase
MKIIHYKSTPVFVDGKWEDLPKLVDISGYSKVILVIDENVFRLWENRFTQFEYLIVPSGEEQKSLVFVEKLVQGLIALGADRSTLLVGVGGGVVCDITGFLGAVFMRGIDFGFAPTTLLAQVDAAIGGKNGVNTGDYKNMIGTIVQPKFILTDLLFLNTLPVIEFANGMAEIIKHGCIADATYFSYIESNVEAITKRQLDVLRFVIQRSVEIKASIVAQDERESGLRKLLNYGHTFGHAIEKKFGLPHGYSVSLGIMLVNTLVVIPQNLKADESLRIRQLLANFGLPVNYEEYPIKELLELVLHDKKRLSDELHLITLKTIGQAEIVPFKIDKLTKE